MRKWEEREGERESVCVCLCMCVCVCVHERGREQERAPERLRGEANLNVAEDGRVVVDDGALGAVPGAQCAVGALPHPACAAIAVHCAGPRARKTDGDDRARRKWSRGGSCGLRCGRAVDRREGKGRGEGEGERGREEREG